jgi:uncharacterized protein
VRQSKRPPTRLSTKNLWLRNPTNIYETEYLAVALDFVNQLRGQPHAVPIRPGPRHWAIFEKLLRASDATGNLVPDAYHAALAIESGCDWITTDKGFLRFAGWRARHPCRKAL